MQFFTFLGANREKYFFSNKTIKRMWTPLRRVIWAINGDDLFNRLICIEAHKTLKKEKNRRLRVTISRMCRHAPFEPTDPNTCMWGGVPNIINRANFFENRPKGFGAGRPRNIEFPIVFAGHPFNTLTLPCEVVWYQIFIKVLKFWRANNILDDFCHLVTAHAQKWQFPNFWL